MHFINLILDSLGRSSLGSRLGFSFHIAYFNSYHNNNLYHFKIGICELTINQIGLGTALLFTALAQVKQRNSINQSTCHVLGPPSPALMLCPLTSPLGTTSAFTFYVSLLEVLTKNIIVKLGYFVKIT